MHKNAVYTDFEQLYFGRVSDTEKIIYIYSWKYLYPENGITMYRLNLFYSLDLVLLGAV